MTQQYPKLEMYVFLGKTWSKPYKYPIGLAMPEG